MRWILKPQECTGIYMFSGQFLITQGIQSSLSDEEIRTIYLKIQALAQEAGGLDYLQVFVDEESSEKLFFIDQLNREMIASGDCKMEDNYCTLMKASEY